MPSYRDYIILAVMAGCGLREAEVRTLTDPRIRHAAEELILRAALSKIAKRPHCIWPVYGFSNPQDYAVSASETFDATSPLLRQ
jgi:hypothetical protein